MQTKALTDTYCLQPTSTYACAHDHHCSPYHNHCSSHNHQSTFSPTPASQVCSCHCTAMLMASVTCWQT